MSSSGGGSVTRVQRLGQVLAGIRSELLDAVGLGLLATAAFTWSVTAGFVAAGLAVLALNWRLNEGRG
uniref:MFS transporter n=1 Tax=Streptomyces sp. NBC_00180 TaxID=2903632 RepID=A0AAU1I3F3_9ACTN